MIIMPYFDIIHYFDYLLFDIFDIIIRYYLPDYFIFRFFAMSSRHTFHFRYFDYFDAMPIIAHDFSLPDFDIIYIIILLFSFFIFTIVIIDSLFHYLPDARLMPYYYLSIIISPDALFACFVDIISL